MRRSFSKDDVNFQNSEWFVALITNVGSGGVGECETTPYGWELLDYCANGQGFQQVGTADLSGTTTVRQAYPIDANVTVEAGATVLMRLRGTFNGQTVYEFMTMGGGGGGGGSSTSCFGVKNVSCSSGILMVTLADSGGCIGCTSGAAFYSLSNKLTVSNNTQTGLPGSDWSLIYGDLDAAGLTIDGDTFKNVYGDTIKVKVTLQYYWTPASTSGSTRSAYVIRNADPTDIPVAGFVASNNTNVAQTVINTFTLGDEAYFQPYAYQNSGSVGYLADPDDYIPTTILIERLC